MPGERRRFEVQVDRRPRPDVDLGHVDALRAHLLQRVEAQVRHTGRCDAGFRYFGAELEEWADAGAPEPGDERFFSTCFRQLGEREGVLRRVREGEALVRHGDGLRRVAVVLEWMPRDGADGWWLAWRRIGEREGAVGVFFGDWEVREGEGVPALPEPFDEWLEAEEIESAELSQHAAADPPGELLYGAATMATPAPVDAVAVIDLATPMTHREVAENGLRAVQAVTFKGLRVEHYVFLGRLGGTLDDVARNLGWQADLDAIVVVFPGVATVDGTDQRAVMTVSELRSGERAHRVVPVEWDEQRRVRLTRAFTRPLPLAGGADRWLGVEPSIRFDLSAADGSGAQLPEA